MKKKHTLEECQSLAKEKNGECLSSEYVGYQVKMKWKCNCGHEWYACFSSIKNNNSWCPKCAMEKRKLSLNNKEVKEKARQTCLERYGGNSPFFSKDVREKTNSTFLNRYGSHRPNQSKEVKEKARQTCLERYGGSSSTCSEVTREKARKTCLERYGGNSSSCSKEVRDKQRKTCIERYGVDSPLRNKDIKEKVKKTCQERYGVDNPSQDLEIALKIARKVNKPSIKLHWQTNEELVCQGSWEAKVVDYLNQNKINYQWQLKTFILLDGRTYRPDLYLVDTDTWVEIKGYFREDAKLKWTEFITMVKSAELWNKEVLISMDIL